MTCDDCRWAAAHPVAAAEFDDEGHAKCRATGQGRCTCQHRGTPYAVNVDKDAPAESVKVTRGAIGQRAREVLRRFSRRP